MDFVSRAAAIATAAMASATAVADAVAVRAAAATEVTRAVAAQGLGHFLVPSVADVQDVHVAPAVHVVTIDERLQEFITQYKADSEAANQRIFHIELWRDLEKFEQKFITNKDHYQQQLEVNTRLDNLLVTIASQQALLDDLLADSKATKQRIFNNELCCVREQLAVDKRIDHLSENVKDNQDTLLLRLGGIKKRMRLVEKSCASCSDSEESEDCCTNCCTDWHDNGRMVCRRES